MSITLAPYSLPPDGSQIGDQKERFDFGKNWQRFLKVLDEERIDAAVKSLQNFLGIDSLAGKTFLDVGSGSGLFSLAAHRLGASRVHSFDFDVHSTECTRELRRRYYPDLARWTIEEGSALDAHYLAGLGKFDIVYSWGVLHHTGAMHRALENVVAPVADGGLLFIAIYNDQGELSKWWRSIKKTYNCLPRSLRIPFTIMTMAPFELRKAMYYLLTAQPIRYVRSWTRYFSSRGMSRWHDMVDWVGGYPFEVARPEEIFRFFREWGFTLENLTTCGGKLGCNQYLFRKPAWGPTESLSDAQE